MANTGTVWTFDLGKGSIGEAGQLKGKFLQKASLLIPAEPKKKGLRKPRMEVIVRLAAAARLFPTIHGRPTGFDPQPL